MYMKRSTRRTRVAGLGLILLLSGLMADAIALVSVRAAIDNNARAGENEMEPVASHAQTRDPVQGTHASALHANQDSSPWAARQGMRARAGGSLQLFRADKWSVGILGITVALAVCGAIASVVRRLAPSNVPVAATVISRMCLSPKHTLYVVQIGQRMLLVGTGPQAAPAVLSELDELPVLPQNLSPGGEA
jgi:flagellar biogenesis protein FliO